MSDDKEVRQLLVHPVVWPDLVAWLRARNISVHQMSFSGDDLPIYVMSPELTNVFAEHVKETRRRREEGHG